jgi:hypothetical protein
MIKIRKGCRLFAGFLAFIAFSNWGYACEPVAVVVRTAENATVNKGTEPETLTLVGKIHAAGYAMLGDELKKKYPTACKITNIVVNDRGNGYSENTYNTALPFANNAMLTPTDRRPNGLFTVLYSNWDTNTLKSLNSETAVGSTFIVFNHNTLWGTEDEKLDESRLLAKLLNNKSTDYTANLNRIVDLGMPVHNFVYVYSDRQGAGTYNTVKVYHQVYTFKLKDGTQETKCYRTIHADPEPLSIINIAWQDNDNGCVQ